MKKSFVLGTITVAATLLLSGCCNGNVDVCKCKSIRFSKRIREEVVAVATTAPLTVDGKLDEADWKNAPAYTMVHSSNQYQNSDWDIQEFFGRGVVEPGTIRVLWDEKHLYVGIELTDRDLRAEDGEDQKHLYKTGDVAEVFLKPANRPWYWEIYASPLGNKTAFYYSSRGILGLPSGFQEKLPLKGLKTAVVAYGTVNDPSDHDVKWTAEIAIPRDEISHGDTKLAPNVPWLIFFGRYNYGIYLLCQENSCFPCQPMPNFHNHAGYAALKMVEKKK